MNPDGSPEPWPPPLGALDPDAPTPFGRASLLRRVVAEPVVALMIQRALVMDVAHPLVAAGVEEHSRFRSQPWRRAWITVDAALRLVFGDTRTAAAAARQIYATHDHIHGTLAEGTGPFEAGAAYTAHDASLLAWVWATLVDSAEVAYTRWVGPFTPAEADEYYADMVAFARFVGIPAGLLPADRPAFAALARRHHRQRAPRRHRHQPGARPSHPVVRPPPRPVVHRPASGTSWLSPPSTPDCGTSSICGSTPMTRGWPDDSTRVCASYYPRFPRRRPASPCSTSACAARPSAWPTGPGQCAASSDGGATSSPSPAPVPAADRLWAGRPRRRGRARRTPTTATMRTQTRTSAKPSTVCRVTS